MISRLLNFMLDLRDRQRINIALSKGIASRQARSIDLTKPASWEFSGFSQNGEDGIIDVLRSQLKGQNRYCIEIGAADGIENNTAWLIATANYNGVAIEGNSSLVTRARRTILRYSIGAQSHCMFVKRETVPIIRSLSLYSDPDVLSLDIDGNDYYIAEALFTAGFRPKIFVVEYNSAFGPERCVTIPYEEDFVFTQAHATQLYYGVSIAAWMKLFSAHGYRFITTDGNGVNAFFVDPGCFVFEFLSDIQGAEFSENVYQLSKYQESHKEQFALIASMPLRIL